LLRLYSCWVAGFRCVRNPIITLENKTE